MIGEARDACNDAVELGLVDLARLPKRRGRRYCTQECLRTTSPRTVVGDPRAIRDYDTVEAVLPRNWVMSSA